MTSNISRFPGRNPQGRFLTGNIGGPGRPRGSRNRLNEHFITDLLADWEEHGADVISRVRVSEPATYLRAVALICRPLLHIERDEEPDEFDRLETVDEVMEALAARLGAEKAKALAIAMDVALPTEAE
jgi:hypothetical protein